MASRRFTAQQRRIETAVERLAIGQPGQPVVPRLEAQLLLHVSEIAEQPAVVVEQQVLADEDQHGDTDGREELRLADPMACHGLPEDDDYG